VRTCGIAALDEELELVEELDVVEEDELEED